MCSSDLLGKVRPRGIGEGVWDLVVANLELELIPLAEGQQVTLVLIEAISALVVQVVGRTEQVVQMNVRAADQEVIPQIRILV